MQKPNYLLYYPHLIPYTLFKVILTTYNILPGIIIFHHNFNENALTCPCTDHVIFTYHVLFTQFLLLITHADLTKCLFLIIPFLSQLEEIHNQVRSNLDDPTLLPRKRFDKQ